MFWGENKVFCPLHSQFMAISDHFRQFGHFVIQILCEKNVGIIMSEFVTVEQQFLYYLKRKNCIRGIISLCFSRDVWLAKKKP